MRYEDLLHVVHAAATVTGETEIVVIGSQSILGSHPHAPAALLRSMEADIYPPHAPEKSDAIDGALGDGSPFHQAYGYYAHAVGPETAAPPRGWQDRLVSVEVPPRTASDVAAVALCLEPHDLVLAKLVAHRPRDLDFARDALDAGVVDPSILRSRAADLPVPAEQMAAVSRTLEALLSG